MYIPRTAYENRIKKAFTHVPIVTLIGARQVGKTTIMKNIHLGKKTLFLDGQKPEISDIFQKYSVSEKYLQLNLNSTLDGFVLIDEFQFIPNISTMLKLLSDSNENLKFFCSGSSSLDIIQKVEESLAGRVRILAIYSLSFEEYLKFIDSDSHDQYQKYNLNTEDILINSRIKLHLTDYLIYGGFPRIALKSRPKDKIELLDDIYQTYLLRDVKNYIRNEDTVGFNKLLRLLAVQIGNIMNINELSKSCGLSYRKCEEYIYLLEQMYIIKRLDPYYTNKKKVITKMKKVYFTDLGLRNMIYRSFNPIEFRTDNGMIFENFVFLEVIKNLSKASQIYFYRTRDGAEVDFILDTLQDKISIEVKFKSFNKAVHFKNLASFNLAENVQNSYLVNLDLNSEKDGVKFIPGYLVDKINFA